MAVYKRVTVVSTLVAMVCIVGGFALLDRATNRATLPVDEVNPWLALAGLGLIAFGGLTYAYSTRFRAAGMGSSKTDEDRPTDDG
ncbi:hypothetical protein BRD00_12075 [Halobacteriales archaeon QS_8_69_26]|nr:MAG: hypothetical protein BRD00_12075 [Halobacteriales archaeon QS_8_69_26]